MLKTVSSIANALGALNYKGTWNASTNVPTLASGVGTQGDYYVVSVAGSTDLDGVTNWGVGDWAAFNGSVWQRLEGGADGNFVNLTVSNTATVDGLATFNGNAEFPDNSKAIFGAGSDLQIYHDGSNSYIKEDGTGNLRIQADDLYVFNVAGNSVMISALDTGKVGLGYAGTERLATTATGINVAGTADVTSDLNVGGAVKGNAGTRAVSVGAAGSVIGGLQLWSTTGGTSFVQFGDEAGTPGNHYRGYISYAHANDSMALGTAGSTKVTVTSAGSVGIGTSAPDSKIHLNDGTLHIQQTDGSDTWFGLGANNDNYITTGASGITVFRAVGTERMRIDGATGNVGIGTDSPAYLFVISDGGNIGFEFSPDDQNTGVNRIYSYDRGTSAYKDVKISASQIIFGYGSSGGNEAMRILADGSVCQGNTVSRVASNYSNQAGAAWHKPDGHYEIATTSDVAPLQIGKNNANDGSLVVFRKQANVVGSIGVANGNNLTVGGSVAAHIGLQFGTGIIYPTDNTGAANDAAVDIGASGQRFKDLYLSGGLLGDTLTFKNIAGSEAARFDSGGSFYVGTTTTGSNVANGFTIQNPAGATYTTLGHANATATGAAYTVFSYNSGTIGSITQSGTTAVLYNTTSDQRLKENIADADDAGSKIDSIQVRKFDWKADGSHQDYGMVAQELLEVAPSAVSAPEDSEEMMGVDYSKLVPMMLKEIQSLRQRIAQLES
jgi:hypothetical protein